MQAINEKSRQILLQLIDGLIVGGSRKIDNNPGVFSPVTVKCLRLLAQGFLYSLTHYWELNGDLMRDPDMEFFATYNDQGLQFYPVHFRQDAPYFEQQAVEYGPGEHITGFYPDVQHDLVDFANMWLANIAKQQKLDLELEQEETKESTMIPA